MSDDASNTAQIQQCLDDIHGGDVQKRNEALAKMPELVRERTQEWASRKLHGKLQSVLGNKGVTDDLRQDLLLWLLQAIKDNKIEWPSSVAKLDGLMRWHLRNKAVDINRSYYGKKGSKRPKEVKKGNDSGPAPIDLVADPHTGPATAAQRSEIRKLAEKLEGPRRSVYMLFLEGTKEPAEIGAKLGIPASTAKYHLNMAKAEIGKQMLAERTAPE